MDGKNYYSNVFECCNLKKELRNISLFTSNKLQNSNFGVDIKKSINK